MQNTKIFWKPANNHRYRHQKGAPNPPLKQAHHPGTNTKHVGNIVTDSNLHHIQIPLRQMTACNLLTFKQDQIYF